MIALAGTLGAGLFIYSGSAISTAGPAGALIAYILCATFGSFAVSPGGRLTPRSAFRPRSMGSIAWALMQCLGEMLCFAPIAGSYIQMAQRYQHPSISFALGYLVRPRSPSCAISPVPLTRLAMTALVQCSHQFADRGCVCYARPRLLDRDDDGQARRRHHRTSPAKQPGPHNRVLTLLARRFSRAF
jgi:hypothetical protein